jgi:hypothetical protein
MKKGNLPSSIPMPHISWLLPVLLRKDNSQLTAKKDLTIHVIFSLCSIGRVYKLHKPKTTRISAKNE